MIFKFEKGARDRGRESLVATLVLSIIMGAGVIYMINLQTEPTVQFFGRVIGWITSIVMLVITFWSLSLMRKSQNWYVEVTEHTVIWRAPEGIGETSFQFSIDDIDRVISRSPSTIEGNAEFILVTKKGEEIVMKPVQSGINITRFIQSLQSFGVPYENV